MRVFYGWWIVGTCMHCSLVGNALGLFGAGVYFHEVVTANGWTTGLVDKLANDKQVQATYLES